LDDSLKYGLPGGLLSFGLLLIMGNESVPSWTRWLMCAALLLPISMYFIRKKNRAYFPFSFAFLSGFNLSIVMVLVHVGLLAAFGEEFFPPAPDASVETKWLFFQAFQEGIGFLFIAMVILLLTSLIFMRRKKI
jgi:hypothetical protein